VVFSQKFNAKLLNYLFRVFEAIHPGGEAVNVCLYDSVRELDFTILLFEGANQMAFIDIDSVDAANTATFYNVSEGVGYGGKNMIEDVKVVQFFMQRFYVAFNDFTKPQGEMVPDGKCGPITRAWITKVQIDLRKLGANCAVDGLINKAGNAGGNRTASISHTNYTIRFLNNALRREDLEVYKNLTTHPVVPADLKLIFLQIQAEGPPMSMGASA
jgi:hypothetical protein